MSIEDLVRLDEDFTESKFIAKVDNTFIMILSGIMMWDIERVKHKISKELFDYYKRKVEELKNSRTRQMFDELNVKSTSIQTIEETEDEYIITVLLISTYMDYTINADTGEYISGIKDRRIERFNNLTFKKIKNAKDNGVIMKCATCGAAVDINNSGICEFCHNTFNLEDYDWILTNIS